jgi:hypothetical protein
MDFLRKLEGHIEDQDEDDISSMDIFKSRLFCVQVCGCLCGQDKSQAIHVLTSQFEYILHFMKHLFISLLYLVEQIWVGRAVLYQGYFASVGGWDTAKIMWHWSKIYRVLTSTFELKLKDPRHQNRLWRSAVRYGGNWRTAFVEDKSDKYNQLFAWLELHCYYIYMTQCQIRWKLEDRFLGVGKEG